VVRKFGVITLIVRHESENDAIHTLVRGLIGVLSPAAFVVFPGQLASFEEVPSHYGLP
jgi:hypothetical protein